MILMRIRNCGARELERRVLRMCKTKGIRMSNGILSSLLVKGSLILQVLYHYGELLCHDHES